MHQKYFLSFMFLFMFCTAKIHAQENLSPIDSLYLNSIEQFYEYAEEYADDIWPGMDIAPVILYRMNGPAFLYNHPDPPESFTKLSDNLYLGSQNEHQLFGDSITEINGTLTAIANYGYDIYTSTAQAYATLFHELHHVWQSNILPDLHPGSIADEITYPEEAFNDALKKFEQRMLYMMNFETDDTQFNEMLNRFYSSRLKREEIIDRYTDFEQALETFEGPAFYMEYRFYKKFSNQPEFVQKNYIHNHFWAPLITPNYGRENLRIQHVAAGFAMSRLLKEYHPDWKSKFYQSGMTLFEFFVHKFEPKIVELPSIEKEIALSRYHTERMVGERNLILQQFHEQPGLKVVLDFETTPNFRGFDPINAISIDEKTVLHKTALRLGRDDNELFVQNKDLITEIGSQVFTVNRVILFVPEHSIDLDDKRLVIDDEGVAIRWSGKLISRENNKIHFRTD